MATAYGGSLMALVREARSEVIDQHFCVVSECLEEFVILALFFVNFGFANWRCWFRLNCRGRATVQMRRAFRRSF